MENVSSWWPGDTDNARGIELNSLTSCTGYTHLICEPTNFEQNKLPSCIDLIFTKIPSLVVESGVHSSLFNTCHHHVIFAKMDFQVHLPPPLREKCGVIKKQKKGLSKNLLKTLIGILLF